MRQRESASSDATAASDPDAVPSTYQEELRTFLFLTVVTAPVLAVAIVGGYGFMVWMYQLFTGDLPG
jgi:nitrate reductase NapE